VPTHLRRTSNVLLYLLALMLLSYTFWNEGRVGQHWVFVAVYVLTLLVAAWYRRWLTCLLMCALIWLRVNLAEHIGGFPLRLSSALFAVLLLALVLRACENDKSPTG
jgi:hypothetical protein